MSMKSGLGRKEMPGSRKFEPIFPPEEERMLVTSDTTGQVKMTNL